jgi:hypothetical protein
MILVLLIVMGLILMMSYFKFQTTLATLIQNRLTVISITMGESIESAIDLGLGLGEIRTAEAVIARVKRNDPGIAFIHIFDNNGQILYSTQKGRAGIKVPPYVLQALEESDGQSWRLDRGDSFVNGFSLLNSFDQMVGGVVLTYSKDAYNTLRNPCFHWHKARVPGSQPLRRQDRIVVRKDPRKRVCCVHNRSLRLAGRCFDRGGDSYGRFR